MHLAKHMQFHGVDYIVVPVELWEDAKQTAFNLYASYAGDLRAKEIYEQMCAYDNSNEPAEIPNE